MLPTLDSVKTKSPIRTWTEQSTRKGNEKISLRKYVSGKCTKSFWTTGQFQAGIFFAILFHIKTGRGTKSGEVLTPRFPLDSCQTSSEDELNSPAGQKSVFLGCAEFVPVQKIVYTTRADYVVLLYPLVCLGGIINNPLAHFHSLNQFYASKMTQKICRMDGRVWTRGIMIQISKVVLPTPSHPIHQYVCNSQCLDKWVWWCGGDNL